MSTSAIYMIEHPMLAQPVSYYVYQDNDPESAALYFWKMHEKIMDRLLIKKDELIYQGELAAIFMKSNPDKVKFTSDDDLNDCTPYRYKMNKAGYLKAYQYCDDTKQYVLYFSGHYAEFINQYISITIRKGKQRLLNKLPESMLKHTSIRYLTTYHMIIKIASLYCEMLNTLTDESFNFNSEGKSLDDWIAACQAILDSAQNDEK